MRAWLAQLLVIAVCGVCCPSYAEPVDCKKLIAPRSDFKDPPSWGEDSGIIVAGHVELWGSGGPAAGKIYDVEHGTDLSRYDVRRVNPKIESKVDYKKLSDCGTAFAFTRIAYGSGDKLFRFHAEELRQNNIINIAYYFFPISRGDRYYKTYEDTDQTQINAHLKKFKQIGQNAAQDFVSQLKLYKSDDIPVISLAGVTGQFVALDIEQKPCDSPSGRSCSEPATSASELGRRQYGRYYAKATCAWIDAVEELYPKLQVILYTTPSVWLDYLSNSYPAEYACLRRGIMWVARTYKTGDDVDTGQGSRMDKAAQRLCRVSGDEGDIHKNNRCLVHQYTHRNLLAGVGPPEKYPNHIDVERFFRAQQIQTAAGAFWIRSGAEKPAPAAP